MLEKPALPDEKIIACLQEHYTIATQNIAFLPLGADRHTAVYRVTSNGGAAYFCKLRGGDFVETAVTVPKFLSAQNVPHILAPITTNTGQLWTTLDEFKLILYPFIEGQDAYQIGLTKPQWNELGRTLKQIHTIRVPLPLRHQIPQETYSPQWREAVRAFVARVDNTFYPDALAVKLQAFVKTKRVQLYALVRRAEELERALRFKPPPFVLCHADIHAWNVLLETRGEFYIVDWDTVLLAPKERDLMFIGAGLFGNRQTPPQEETLFYEGYGQTEIDGLALAYYRYERIIEDIAVECEQILAPNVAHPDRAREFEFLQSNFEPGGTIEIAYKFDKSNL